MRQAQGQPLSPERAVLIEAFHEVEATLEELSVVEEELRRQNEELADARGVIEAERQRYRHLFDFAPNGYLVTDASGLILEANHAVSIMLNIAPRNLQRKPLATYLNLGDKGVLYQRLNALESGEQRVDFDVQVTPRGGAAFDVSIAASPGPQDAFGAPTFLWVLQDITERKRIAAKLAAGAAETEQRAARQTTQLSAAYEHPRRFAETLQLVRASHLPIDDPALQLYSGAEAAPEEAQAGGVFSDAFPLDGRVALLAGEVVVDDGVGNGLAAAVYASHVRFLLRAFLNQGMDGGLALSQLSDSIETARSRGDWSANTAVSLSLVVAEKSSHRIQVFSAGTETFLLRPSGAADAIPCQGAILGVSPGARYEPVTDTLAHGDMAVLATSGFTQARRTGNPLEMEGLARLAQQAVSDGDGLDIIGSAIQRGLREYAGGQLHHDACILIARRV
ncbi:hypothetical protein CCAX7_21930 [Capsulimonas corticalis]|uniref:Uncharacterized protein n=1 Tax=Capsulimonas corticalis TaxID=2219043 RepID=A0A402D276_9BACT|nr:hypothetical protein CCAX7_21930 [Capsulimonas corticalis]